MIFRFRQIVPDKISDKFTEGIFCIRSSIRVALNGNPLGSFWTPLGRMKVKGMTLMDQVKPYVIPLIPDQGSAENAVDTHNTSGSESAPRTTSSVDKPSCSNSRSQSVSGTLTCYSGTLNKK